MTTNDESLAAMVRSIANYGSSAKYVHLYKGINSRLDELQAAVLRLKLSRLDADNERRRLIASQYMTHIQNTQLTLPRVDDWQQLYFIFSLSFHLAVTGCRLSLRRKEYKHRYIIRFLRTNKRP